GNLQFRKYVFTIFGQNSGRKAYPDHILYPGPARRVKLFGILYFKGRLAWINALVGRTIRSAKDIGQRHMPGLGRYGYGPTRFAGHSRWYWHQQAGIL